MPDVIMEKLDDVLSLALAVLILLGAGALLIIIDQTWRK